MAAENIIFNRRATLAWQSSSPGSRQAQPVQIDPLWPSGSVWRPLLGGGRPRAGPGPAAGRPHYRFYTILAFPDEL